VELKIRRAQRPLTGRWAAEPVEPAGQTLLGLSFRPLQAEALGLDPRESLKQLLEHPYGVIRLAAYWDRLEPAPGKFDPSELDWQVEEAERAGKQVIICLGAVKGFGYPEFFVPGHHLPTPLPERTLIEPHTHPHLLEAATAFLTRVVRHYASHGAVIAWQVEHEAVDPLGMEHSWRLSERFVAAETEAVRAADPSRAVVLNSFLPTSVPVRVQQWSRTRDQGDSLAVARRLADVVGAGYYPRNAVVRAGGWTVYLDGSKSRWQLRRLADLMAWAASSGRRVMISEGQAEPWEAVTTPPSAPGVGMYSCLPEHVIENYNQCKAAGGDALWAYLFWGAEYWLLRRGQGDERYLQAFGRVLAAR
jgi:glycosyl hydrolase family 42 (putative beta-galactosidase)